MDVDEHSGNPCLREKLKAEHDIQLPRRDEIESPLEYLNAVEAAVKGKPQWRVHQSMALGFFNFARYRLWLDLDEAQWPEGKGPSGHPIVRDLVDQKWRGDTTPLPSDGEVAAHQQERDLPVVLDADSTQYAALMTAARGQSLVVIGPPGSGKSQTITNLIAAAMAEGKRVLFVAQKLAALQVVQHRLQEVGLAPFCLSLHSDHAKPLDAHKQLRAASDARSLVRVRAHESRVPELARSLNDVAARLAAWPDGYQETVSEIVQRACALRAQARERWADNWDDGLLDLDVPPAPIPAAWAEERERTLTEWVKLRAEAGTAWEGWKPLGLFPMDVARVATAMNSLAAAASALEQHLQGLPEGCHSWPISVLSKVAHAFTRAALPSSLLPSLLKHIWLMGGKTQPIHQLERQLEDYARQRERAFQYLQPGDEPPLTYGQAVVSAAKNLGNALDQMFPLKSADLILKELSGALNQAHDLVADADAYPNGVLALGGTRGAELTWALVYTLAGMTLHPELESRPFIQGALAAFLADDPGRSKDLTNLRAQVQEARANEAAVNARAPALLAYPQERRGQLQAVLERLVALGVARVQLEGIGDARFRFVACLEAADVLVQTWNHSEHALSHLLPHLSAGACRSLALKESAWTREVLSPPKIVLTSLVRAIVDATITCAEASAWEGRLANVCREQAEILARLPKAYVADPAFGQCQLETNLIKLTKAGAGPETLAGTRRALAVLARYEKLLVAAAGAAAEVAAAAGIDAPRTLADVQRVTRLAELLSRPPVLPPGGLLDQVTGAADVMLAQKAIKQAELLAEREGEISRRFALADLPSRERIASIRRTLRSRQHQIFRWLASDYRAARRELRDFVQPPVPRNNEAIRSLEALEGFLADREAFAGEPALARLLGPAFKGHNTDWSGVAEALWWAADLYESIDGASIPLTRLSAVVGRKRAALEALRTNSGLLERCELEVVGSYAWALGSENADSLENGRVLGHKEVEPLCQNLRATQDSLKHLVDQVESLGGSPEMTWEVCGMALSRWRNVCEQLTALAELSHTVAKPLNSISPDALAQTLRWYHSGLAHEISQSHLLWLAENGPRGVDSTLEAIDLCRQWTTAAEIACKQLQQEWVTTAPVPESQVKLGEILAHLEALSTLATAPMPLDVSTEEMLALVLQVERLNKLRADIAPWDQTLGEPAFSSDLELLARTAEWVGHAANTRVPNRFIQWFLEAECTPRLQWWNGLARRAKAIQARLHELMRSGLVHPDDVKGDQTVQAWRTTTAERYATLAASSDLLLRKAVTSEASVGDIGSAGTALIHACRLGEELAGWCNTLGCEPTNLSAKQVAAHRHWISDTGSLPTDIVKWIVEEHTRARWEAMVECGVRANGVHVAVHQLRSLMKNFGELGDDGPEGVFATELTTTDVQARVRRLTAILPKLLPKAMLLRVEAQARDLGLGDLLHMAEETAMQAEDLVLTFRAGVAYQQARAVWQKDLRLSAFRGSEHDTLRKRFNESDRSQLSANRKVVAAKVATMHQPGNTTRSRLETENREATPEMYAVLKHEEAKKKRHLPIRKLVERAGPAMQEYCPCWLLTPMAVAQFMPPGSLAFDLVIMDEASQLPPEDAWGAIARGKQLVVVGDPKQMPPSDFFASSAGDDDEARPEEEETSGVKLDSILDAAANCLPQSWLTWHYRSRHQSLIAAANRFSYNDRLILFPSAHDSHIEMGLRHTYVPEAVTTQGRVVNAKEAMAVVDRVIQLALGEARKPLKERRTVGVVAMNAAQHECIQSLLDEQRSARADVDRAIAALEEHPEEPLIVRNLENIQGDQRDIILISYTYGSNSPNGGVAQRFGPLNMDGGERRFNVLITRAKWRMEVFASLRSDQIQAEKRKPGVQHYHYFLKYAETGRLIDAGEVTGRGSDSPFEEYVAAALRGKGYAVEHQVGVAGYFVDLAVRHPADPNRFALGIECDGASYHSSKAARDRDRLREQVLADRGWKLYRLWSTDWFTNHDAAAESLLNAVAKACDGAAVRT
jgi:very-short-patch-repair endonuclease